MGEELRDAGLGRAGDTNEKVKCPLYEVSASDRGNFADTQGDWFIALAMTHLLFVLNSIGEIMEKKPSKPIEILLIEDNPGDVELVKEGLSEGKVLNKLYVAKDGEEGMKFLRSTQTESSERPCPDLILLDLNLPKKSGREVLQEIKRDPYLQTIPVVILTSSKQEEDICRSYEQHANCYITKPVGFEQFMRVIKSIEEFWFTVVKLPCRPEHSGMK